MLAVVIFCSLTSLNYHRLLKILALWMVFIVTAYVSCLAEKNTGGLHKFKQPDDVDTLYYLAPTNTTESCTRECSEGDNRICYYKFYLENYAILSAACVNCLENEEDCYLPQCVTADGFEKGILTVNRRIPGPSIQVCYGDRIVVDVENAMLSRTMAFHWHGITQRNRNYMDGVPFINQCPILEDTTFRYDFQADTAGTMYWYAHSALHKVNGLQGSLIVRVPKEYEPHYNLYDFDLPAHNLFIMDWYHTDPETRMPGVIHHDIIQLTTYYLINGRGKYKFSNGTSSMTPMHVYHVKQEKRYRFRVTAALSTHCPAVVQIEKHKLLMIASDGSPFKPVLVDSFTIFSGERYDFVLNANAEVGIYWIQVRSVQNCFKNDVYQMAVLKYETSMDKTPRLPNSIFETLQLDNTVLNPVNTPCSETTICITQLESIRKVPERIINQKPDFNFEFVFGFYFATREELFQSGNYPHFLQITPEVSTIPHINNIQFITPSSPLQSQYDDIPSEMFCQNGTDGLPVCPQNKTVCQCLPIVRIPLGSMVQFVIIDRANLGTTENHAFHLHGYTFNIIATGNLPDNLMNAKDIAELIEIKKIPIPASPVFKDTLAVPSRGYAVIRFIADNPGFWFFHCHFLYHHIAGMGTILQIGDQSEFPSLPEGFPKCGDYVPPVRMLTVIEKTSVK